MIQFTHSPSGEKYAMAKAEVDRRYAAGQFVALDGLEVVADAESHRKLVEKLSVHGRSPKDLVILQAGAEYPESAVSV